MERRKLVMGRSEGPNTIYFSAVSDPNEFPKIKSYWVGSHRLAKWLAKVINKAQCRWYGHWNFPQIPFCTRCGKRTVQDTDGK